jgi:NAD(P)-dependent dehydrogenase (short-subunit alcohol dehydrogenase family)
VAGANGGLGGGTIYGSTKAALRSFGRTIAKELTPRCIRVNTISAGPIITPILDKGGLTPAAQISDIEGRLRWIVWRHTDLFDQLRHHGSIG